MPKDITDPAAAADEIYEATPDDLIELAAKLHIRQMVRAELRHAYEEDLDRRQWVLPDFPLLQDRYPTVDGRGYIKRDLMSRDDWAANVDQLTNKGGKLLEHAKQLREWGRDRFPPDPNAAKG